MPKHPLDEIAHWLEVRHGGSDCRLSMNPKPCQFRPPWTHGSGVPAPCGRFNFRRPAFAGRFHLYLLFAEVRIGFSDASAGKGFYRPEAVVHYGPLSEVSHGQCVQRTPTAPSKLTSNCNRVSYRVQCAKDRRLDPEIHIGKLATASELVDGVRSRLSTFLCNKKPLGGRASGFFRCTSSSGDNNG